MWDYYWGLTAAQIELLAVDAPMVVYPKEKKRDKNGKVIMPKANPVDVLRKRIEYEDKYKDKENRHTLDLSGFGMMG